MNLNNILNEIDNYYKQDENVYNFLNRDKLEKTINFNPLDKIKNDNDMIILLQKIIKYSVKTQHLMFFNQLFKGSNRYNVISDLIVSLLNTSMYTYEMAPVFTLMEEYMGNRIKKLFHFTEGDILFNPGGSLSNILAIHLARFNINKNYKKEGLYKSKKLFIYVSDVSHYSIKKGSSFLGLGTDCVIKIKTDNGRMNVGELEKQILKHRNDISLMVVATAGTTVFGSFDSITEICNICEKYKIWVHIDGSWGGSVIFSEMKHLLNGIERANSFTWNAHKMLNISQQCSILLVRNKDISKECNELDVNYLFPKKRYYPSEWDTGNKYIQCGRKVDILKLWLSWKIKGEDIFSKEINYFYKLVNIFKEKIKSHNNFALVLSDTDFLNVCFLYKKGTEVISPDFIILMKKKMLHDGKIFLSYQKFNNLYYGFRIPIMDVNLKEHHFDYILKTIDYYGKNCV